MKKLILLVVFALAIMNVFGATYYWVGGNTSTGSFTTTSNWNTTKGGGGTNPSSITASANSADIFVFDYTNVGSGATGTSITITNVLTSYQLGGIQVVGGNNLYVKFSAGGAVTINTNLVVDANNILEFTSNTFSFGGSFSPTVNGTLIFGGQGTTTTFPIGTDWTSNNATGTIAYNYNYPQGNCRIIPATYYNLDADYGTGVNRNFGTLTSAIQNFYIKGNFYYTASTNAIQTSVFTFNGGNQTIAPTAFYGLVIGGTGTKTISRIGSIGNTTTTVTTSTSGALGSFGLTINSGAVLDLGDFALSGTVITNNGEIRTASAASLPTPGTLPWGGTVTFNGTGTQSVPATSYTGLKITGAKSSSVSFTGTSTNTSTILTNISSTSGLIGLTTGTITGSAGIGASNATTNTITSVTRGATIKGNTTNGSAQLTTINAANLAVGMTLSGTGIPSGTTISSINQAASVSGNGTSTGVTSTNGSSVLNATSTTGVTVGMFVIASGNAVIPSGTTVTVTGVTSSTITLSSAATGAVSYTGINFSALITMSGNATATNTGTTVTCSPIITMGSAASATNSSQSVSIPSFLTLTSGTTNVAGNMTVDYTGGYGSLVSTGSTFNFNGTGAQTIPALNYNNLTLSGSRSGDITLANSGSIGIAGTFTNSATFTSGSLVNTSSTVNFNGAIQSIPAFTFNHLILSGSGAKTLNASTVINGNLSLQGTATTSTVAATNIGGNLSVGDGTSAATFTSAGYDLTVNGTTSVANTSTLTISSSTGLKTFTGLVTLNSGSIWNNSGNSAVALNGGLTIGGSSVTFTPGTQTTTITGALTTNGAFSLAAGTISLSGTSSIAGSTAPTFNALSLVASAVVTVSTNFTVSGTLTINAGAILDMGANDLLGVTTIANNATGTFKTSSIGTAPFPTGKAIATGTVQFAKTDGGQTIPIGTYTTLTLLNSTGTNTSSGGAVNATTLNTTANGTWDLGTTATLGGTLSTINHNGIIKTAVLSSTSIVPTTTKDFTAGGNATGTVEFYGTGNQSLQNNSSTKFYNLTIRSNSIATAVTATSSLTVNGTLTIEGTMDMGTSSLNVINNVSGTGTFKTQNTGTPITTGKTWAGTVQYNSTSAQNVVAGNYNNLDLTAASAGNRTLANGGTIAIAGTFTPSATGTHTVTGNTISFNGSSSQTIPAFAYNNLTVNNSAGVNLGASISVAGSLALSAGTLTVGANTLTLSGTAPTRTLGNIDASNASSVVAFTNTSAMILPASLFSVAISTLTVNGAGGVTLSEGITISKALNLTSGTITTSGSNIVTFNSGSATPVEIIRTAGVIGGTSQAFTSSVNLTYNNTTTTTSSFEVPLSATKLNNLTINNAGGVVMSADRTINGTLTLSAGTLTIGTVGTPRNLVYKGSNITRTSGNIDASIAGATAGITFSNTSALSLPSGLFSGNLNTLTVNGIGGTVTLPEAVTVNGATNVGAGATVAIGGTLTTTGGVTVNGTLQLNAGGTVTGSGIWSYGALASLIYNNEGSYSTNQEWPSTNYPVNVTIQASGTSVTPNENKTISGNLTIGAGASLNIAAGKQLTVSTTLNNAGTLNLLSTSDGTATILTPTSIGGTGGTTNVSQYLGTARNWYISSPITNAQAPSGYTYYQRDEAGASWTSIPFVATNTFTPGTGYIALPDATDATITFTNQATGKLNTADVPVDLTWSGASSKGFNLIGNPYPCHLTWTKTFTDANASLIESTIYYRTNAGSVNSSGQWSFPTYNAFSGESALGGTAIIPPMQAFWIRSKAVGTLTLDSKLTRSHQSSNPLRTPAIINTDRQRLRLVVSNGTSIDETLVYFDADAANGFDAYDSPKFADTGAAVQIYTNVGDEKLVINGLNSIPFDTEIPLGFTASQAGSNFSIKASQISNFDPSVSIYLKDNTDLINTPIQLTADAAYTFNSGITTDNSSRFSLIFKSPSIATGLNSNANSNVWISVSGTNQLIVNTTANAESSVAVYNTVGQKLYTKNLTSGNTTLNTPLQRGVYLVSVTAGGKSLSKKVIID